MGRMVRSKRIQHSRPYLLNNFLSVQVHKHKLLTDTTVHRLLNQYSFYYLTFFTLVNAEGLVIKRTTLSPALGLMTSPLDNIMILLLGMNVKYNLDVIRLNFTYTARGQLIFGEVQPLHKIATARGVHFARILGYFTLTVKIDLSTAKTIVKRITHFQAKVQPIILHTAQTMSVLIPKPIPRIRAKTPRITAIFLIVSIFLFLSFSENFRKFFPI